MKDITEIIQLSLPIVLMAVIASGIVTVSVEGFKNFFKLEAKGWQGRIVTCGIATLWSYILAIHFGGGTWSDFGLLLTMIVLGASGIYEVLIQKKGNKVD